MFYLLVIHVLLSVSISALDMDIVSQKYLSAEWFDYLRNIGFQMCASECEKKEFCQSFNYFMDNFECRLLNISVEDSNLLQSNPQRMYVRLRSRSTPCNNCTTNDSCIKFTSAAGTCIATINGGWSEWGMYGSCSKTCGEGEKVRYRNCVRPVPHNGGLPCSHLNYSTQPCNAKKCSHCNNIRNLVSEGEVTMSSIYLSEYMLDSDSAWAPNSSSFSDMSEEWIKVTFPSVRYIRSIVTQGRANYSEWVTSYDVYTLDADIDKWIHVGKFKGNKDSSTKVYRILSTEILSKGIRINPKTAYGYPSLRFDVRGCVPSAT